MKQPSAGCQVDVMIMYLQMEMGERNQKLSEIATINPTRTILPRLRFQITEIEDGQPPIIDVVIPYN